MVDLVENIRKAMATPRGGRPVCAVCGRGVSRKDASVPLGGGTFAHRSCATYEPRRRRAA